MLTQRFINSLTVAYIVLLAVFWFAANMIIPTAEGTSVVSALELDKPSVKAQLSLTLDLISRRIALASGLIAACLWILSLPLQSQNEVKQRMILASGAIVAAIFSLLSGYQAYENILITMGVGGFDATSDAVSQPQSLQFGSLVIGTVLLGLCGIRASNAIYAEKGSG